VNKSLTEKHFTNTQAIRARLECAKAPIPLGGNVLVLLPRLNITVALGALVDLSGYSILALVEFSPFIIIDVYASAGFHFDLPCF
jgi:hypothetical protein